MRSSPTWAVTQAGSVMAEDCRLKEHEPRAKLCRSDPRCSKMSQGPQPGTLPLSLPPSATAHGAVSNPRECDRHATRAGRLLVRSVTDLLRAGFRDQKSMSTILTSV